METSLSRLPRGRHGLSRDDVEGAQRERILRGVTAAMHENGFVETSVADVLARARVSRETFYRLFSSKLDCFLAAFDAAGDLLLQRLNAATEALGADDGDRMTRFERLLGVYLETLANEPAAARLFLVEVYAAGAVAIARRTALQQQLVDALADLLDASTASQRFACQMIVSATSALVTPAVVDGDADALRALGPAIADHVGRIWPAVAP